MGIEASFNQWFYVGELKVTLDEHKHPKAPTWEEKYYLKGRSRILRTEEKYFSDKLKVEAKNRIYFPYLDLDGNPIKITEKMYVTIKDDFSLPADSEEVLMRVVRVYVPGFHHLEVDVGEIRNA